MGPKNRDTKKGKAQRVGALKEQRPVCGQQIQEQRVWAHERTREIPKDVVFMGMWANIHQISERSASKDFNGQRVFALIMNCEHFMRVAIEDAKLNGHHFGAVIVKNNEIVAKAGKMPKGDSRFHAETHAILEACENLGTRNLEDCILYSTCEPCPMCFYMAWLTNISKIIYGATIRDCIKLGIPEIRVTAKFLNKRGGNKIKLKRGVLAEDCLKLLAR